jgi:hypothetical protein
MASLINVGDTVVFKKFPKTHLIVKYIFENGVIQMEDKGGNQYQAFDWEELRVINK